MAAAVMRIQNVGNTRVNASPIATAIPVINRKASMAPKNTERALNREDKVMTAICVLSPNSATAISTNDATSGVKLMDKRIQRGSIKLAGQNPKAGMRRRKGRFAGKISM